MKKTGDRRDPLFCTPIDDEEIKVVKREKTERNKIVGEVGSERSLG